MQRLPLWLLIERSADEQHRKSRIMSNRPVAESGVVRALAGHVPMFAAVGISATLTYLGLSIAGAWLGLGAALASFIAYGPSMVVSYCGHRFLTFRSRAPVRETATRFARLSALQYALATAIPVFVTDLAGLAPTVSFLLVCVVIPATSLLAMAGYVFADSARHAPAQAEETAKI